MGNLVTRYFLERMRGADVSLMHVAVAAPFQGAPSTLQQLLFGGTMLTFGLAWQTLNAGASASDDGFQWGMVGVRLMVKFKVRTGEGRCQGHGQP